MSKTVLVTGKKSVLSKKLIDLLADQGYKVIVTMDLSDISADNDNENIRYVPWNRNSPISAKTVILESIKYYGKIDGAFILYNSTPLNQTFYDIPTAVIENTIDSSIKGVIFLVKEIINYFNKVRSGNLNFIIESEETRKKTIIENTCLSGFRGFADNFILPVSSEVFRSLGFQAMSENPAEFASFIYSIFEQNDSRNNGLWHKFGDKNRLISGFPGIKKK